MMDHPRAAAAAMALAALLGCSPAPPQLVGAATIQNVVAPRQQSGGPALDFKGNTAWPYGLCEVSRRLGRMGL